jgi:hypothetical protein
MKASTNRYTKIVDKMKIKNQIKELGFMFKQKMRNIENY